MRLTAGIFIQGLFWAQYRAGVVESVKRIDETSKEITDTGAAEKTNANIHYLSTDTGG